jgi:hypothetical protein
LPVALFISFDGAAVLPDEPLPLEPPAVCASAPADRVSAATAAINALVVLLMIVPP